MRQKVLKCVWNVSGISIPKALKQEKKFIYAKPSVGAYFSSYELFNFAWKRLYLGHLHTVRLNCFPYGKFRLSTENLQINTFLYHFRYTIYLYQCDNYIIENNYRYIKPDGIEFYFRNFQSRLQQRSTIFTIRFIYWLKKLFFPLLVKNHFTYTPSCNDKPRRYLQSRRFTTRDFRSSKSNPIIIAFFQARQNQLCSFLPLVSPTFEGQRLAP